MRYFFILLGTLLALTTMAEAHEAKYSFKGKKYNISYELKNNTQIIELKGNIYSDLVEDLTGYKRVFNMIKNDMDVVVILNSGGGFLLKFDKLKSRIKYACNSKISNCQVTTIVKDFSICASACIPFFMMGDVRKAAAYSSFGFHQAAIAPGMGKIPGLAQRHLRRSGVNRQWLEEHKFMFDSLNMTWIKPRELGGSNIVTKITY